MLAAAEASGSAVLRDYRRSDLGLHGRARVVREHTRRDAVHADAVEPSSLIGVFAIRVIGFNHTETAEFIY